MSDPFKDAAEQKDDQADKKRVDDKAKDEPALSFTDLTSGKSSEFAPSRSSIDFSAEKSLARLDIDISSRATGSFTTFPLGGGAPFQLRKSDFIHPEFEKPVSEFKPLINDFLHSTNLSENDKLSPAESKELDATRESLLGATTAAEALASALHLGRLYQHLRYLEEAKLAVELSLGIDPDNYPGKQLFKELERMHPADIGVTPFAAPAQPLTKRNLRKRILSLTGGRVIVVGDLLIDELLEGRPERISREAPVLILEHVDTELICGGAANTAANIAAIGGVCCAIGVCGEDEYARKLAQLFDKSGIGHGLVCDPERPTTVKTRILSKSHSFKQQLLRLDRICHEPVSRLTGAMIVDRLKEVAPDFRAIILSDYRSGVMTDEVIRGCRKVAAEHNLLLIVDAQDDFPRFQDVTLLTPNQPDTENAVGYEIKSKEDLKRAGQDLMMLTGAQSILITRGSEGMVLFQKDEAMIELPAFNKSEVFDVTGAGDTVVATMALALVTGASFVEAMALGNLAAGIVVKKPGTAVTSQKEMLENLDMLKIEE